MSEIIDIAAVTEKIRKLLKDRGLKEETLAQELNLPTPLLNQNGKFFTKETLRKAAEYFDVPLNTLLCKKEEIKNSAFKRAAEQGVSGIAALTDSGTDVCRAEEEGKYLAEYIMETDDAEALNYLLEKGKLPEPSQRYADVLADMTIFCLKNDLNAALILKKYIEHEGYIDFDARRDKTEAILQLIETKEKFELIDLILNEKVRKQRKLLRFINVYRTYSTKLSALVRETAKLKAGNILNYISDKILLIDSTLIMFAQADFTAGFSLLFAKYQERASAACLLELAAIAAQRRNTTIIRALAESSRINPDECVRICIKHGFDEGYFALIAKYKDAVNASETCKIASKHGRLNVFQSIGGLSEQDLADALYLAPANDAEFLAYLVKRGARFDKKFVTGEDADKMNALADKLLENDKGVQPESPLTD